MNRWPALALPLSALMMIAACTYAPPQGLTAVQPFQVERYLGDWQEIARLDHAFERGLTEVSASYRLLDDGTIEVINRGYDASEGEWQEARGRAKFVDDPDRGSLKVSFFGPFYGGYHVVALDPDYEWSLVVGNDRDYFWILAREAPLADELIHKLLAMARAMGIATTELIWVGQPAPEAGNPQ